MTLNDCKFVGLELSNPNWREIGKLIDEKYHQYIELSKCGSWGRLFEPEPHITLYYSEDNDKGPNWMYWLVSILGRDLYSELKHDLNIEFNTLYIDTFNNQDATVLKLNVLKSNCDKIELFTKYHNFIESHCVPGNYPDYNPHITITYLKPNIDKSIIDSIIKDIRSINGLNNFTITNLMLGGGENSNYKSSKLPLD